MRKVTRNISLSLCSSVLPTKEKHLTKTQEHHNNEASAQRSLYNSDANNNIITANGITHQYRRSSHSSGTGGVVKSTTTTAGRAEAISDVIKKTVTENQPHAENRNPQPPVYKASDVLTTQGGYSIITFGWNDTEVPNANNNNANDVVFFNSVESECLYANSNDPKSFAVVSQWLQEAREGILSTPEMKKKIEKCTKKDLDSITVVTILYPAHPFIGTALHKSLLFRKLFGISDSDSGGCHEMVVYPTTGGHKGIILAKSAWEITYGIFEAQKQVVLRVSLPRSLEQAYHGLSGKMYTCLIESSLKARDASEDEYNLTETGMKNKEDESSIMKRQETLRKRVVADVNSPTPVRLALLARETLVRSFERFGTQGGGKRFSSDEHMIRQAINVVNVFIIHCENKMQSGTVQNGVTFSSDIYCCQSKKMTSTKFRSLQDQNKRDSLTKLLFGEGHNTVTLLIPSAGTKTHQVQFFARMCQPKCPFFICEASSLSRHCVLSGEPVPPLFNSTETNPKKYWNNLVSSLSCDLTDDDRYTFLLKAASAYALEAKNTRIDKNALLMVREAIGKGKIPAPLEMKKAFEQASLLTDNPALMAQESNPTEGAKGTDSSAAIDTNKQTLPKPATVVSAFNQTYVNKVNLGDVNAAVSLDEWKKSIYQCPKRYAREKAASKDLEKYLILDLETTTTRRYKRIANPFTKENWIVLSGAKNYKGEVFMNKTYFPKDVSQNYDDTDILKEHSQAFIKGVSPDSLFFPPLDDYDVIVGHNLKFDLMQLWRDRELRRFLKRGGKIWDTLYGEYLLTGQQVRIGRGAGLESVAKSYGGRTPKLDAVKEAWANGIQTYEIEPKVLIEYLHGDLDNTELIFKEHRKRALEQRQVVICQCRMDSLLCTTEMEYNGLKTDLDIAMKQAIELNLESAKLERETNSLIPTEIPRRLKKFWNWASNSHMAIYFFGGTLEIETQCYKSSSNLSKSGWARHTLSDNRDPTNLGPPNLISAPSECSFLSGGFSSEKSTKLSKSYLLHYFSEGGFRKSAPWPDSLAKTMLAKSRLDPSNVMEGPLINLLPTRYHVLMAAADIDDNTGKIKTLVFQNPISNEVFSFDLSLSRPDDDVTKEIEDFFLDQIRQHTRSVVDSNELMLYLRGAQLILVTRDAPFTWENAFQRDDRLRPIIERYGNNVESYHEFNPEDLCIVPVDCNVTLEFFRTKTSTDKLPSYLKNSHAKKKLSAAPFVTDLRLPAAEWCSVYAKLFREVSHITFADETLDVKKMTKKQKEARKVDEDNLPLLQRPVETLRRELPNLWTPDEVARFEMLFMLGKACATPFDPFYVVSFDKNVDVDIPGVLHSYIPEKGIAMAVMTNFRSHSTNALQVGTETLSYFAKTHKDPVAKSIINLRSMQKLIGTYYEFSEGSTGMVSLVHESDSCIHHELIHTKTNTGRLSAANPNCQNIPKEDKSSLREIFNSRFADGICIEADYSQLEVITLATLARDRQMIIDLKNKVDFHCKRVTMMRPDLEYDEVVLRAKINKEPPYVKMRQQAKIFSFQRQYGAGVKMLSESTGLTHDQVRSMIEREREIYRECDVFSSMVTLAANAYDASLQDGTRNVGGQLLYKGMFPVITGSRYVFSESDLPAVMQENLREGEKKTNFSPTHLKNYPVQGFAAEIVQIMIGMLWRHFVSNDNYNGKALLINTVHDCVWIDCTPELVREVADDVDRIMSSVKTVLNALWPELGCDVDFPVDVVVGENMGHLEPLKDLDKIFDNRAKRAAIKAENEETKN